MRLGKILAIAGLAVALLLVAAILVVSQIDFSRYKPLIAEQVKAATGRDLVIAGAIHLAPSLVPSLAVEDVRFQNASFGSRPEMITAQRLEASVALLPLLLRNELDIRRVVLIAPDILLETDKSGRGNWEFGSAPPSSAASASAPSDTALPSLGALAIQDGLLTYRDGLSGKATKLEVKRLTASGNPLAIDLTGAYDGTPIALKTKLALQGKAVTFADLQATFGTSDLAGNASFDWSARPRIAATLASKLIDLADLMPPTSAPAKRDDGRVFSADPIDLSGLRAFDGRFDVKVATLRRGKLALQDMAAVADLTGGRLALQSFAGRFADGALSGEGHVTALAGPGAETALVFKADKLDLATLARTLDAGDVLSGRGDLSLDLKGQGASLRTLMAGLAGKASWVMGKGRVKNGYVDLMGADLLRFAASAGTGGSDATAVNCFVTRFDVAKGLATSQGILFDTDRMTVKGEGNINLGNERLALLFTPRPKEASLINLALPWHVEGTLKKPGVAVDQGAAAERAAGALLSVINPLALLVPMVTGSGAEQNPCLAALQNAPAKPPAGGSGGSSGGGVRGFLDSLIPGR
jgi:uncharacterized protein involved in outer membrane biogenesis